MIYMIESPKLSLAGFILIMVAISFIVCLILDVIDLIKKRRGKNEKSNS